MALVVGALVCILLSGCSSPDDRAREAIGDIRSWCATIRMTARQWQRGATPNGYAIRSIRTAQRNIRETLRQIDSVPAARLTATDVDTMMARIAAMEPAIERGDRGEIGKLERGLMGTEEKLRGDTTERER
jgi:hypothetical protein